MIYAGIIENSEVNGPGRRNVLFVRGCPHECPGCYNASLWDLRVPGALEATPEDLADKLMMGSPDGVSISGGEPLLQLAELLRLLQSLNREGVSVTIFTGYTKEEIMGSPMMSAVLNLVDILVCGRYDSSQPSGAGLRGSENQEILVLNGEWDKEELETCPHFLEIHSDPPIITGFPAAAILK